MHSTVVFMKDYHKDLTTSAAEKHLVPCKTCLVELFYGNSHRLKTVNYFHLKASS